MKQLKEIRKEFEAAVGNYVKALVKQWELSEHDCFWVGDRIGLDNFCFNAGEQCMSLEEMVYIVEHQMSYDVFLRWSDYCTKCHEYNFNALSLKSFCEGAPRVPQQTFDRLDRMKKDLEDAINEEKSKY